MRHVPCELAAVVHLFSHDEELRQKALLHVDAERQWINWRAIFRNHFGSGHWAAVVWAHALWRDEATEFNPFEAAFSMDAGLRRAVLRALAIRWCVPLDRVNALRPVDEDEKEHVL